MVAVEDSTDALVGAALDTEWLRDRIYERVDIAPAVEAPQRSVRLIVI